MRWELSTFGSVTCNLIEIIKGMASDFLQSSLHFSFLLLWVLSNMPWMMISQGYLLTFCKHDQSILVCADQYWYLVIDCCLSMMDCMCLWVMWSPMISQAYFSSITSQRLILLSCLPFPLPCLTSIEWNWKYQYLHSTNVCCLGNVFILPNIWKS